MVMRTLRLSLAILVAFAVFVLFAERGGITVQVLTGNVVDWQPGRSIAVANEQTDPGGVRITLRGADHDEGPGRLNSGTRVSVWYRLVGESYPVAVKLRVLDSF